MMKFLKTHYPHLDTASMTFISDQDKGGIAAFDKHFKMAVMFFCSFHRKQNIGTNFPKESEVMQSLYDSLLNCKTVAAASSTKEKIKEQLSSKAARYLLKIPDRQQIPIVRAAEGGAMYGRTAQQFVESMNFRNMMARSIPLYSGLRALLDMESERFQRWKEKAHQRVAFLVEKAHTHLIAIKKEVGKLTVRQIESSSVGVVNDGSQQFRCSLDSLSCQCGEPLLQCRPCKHLLAIFNHPATALKIEGEVRTEPECLFDKVWWTTTWQSQYPEDLTFRVPTPDEVEARGKVLTLRKALARARPKGRPRKVKRKTAFEPKKRKVHTCRICRKPGHNFRACPHKNDA